MCDLLWVTTTTTTTNQKNQQSFGHSSQTQTYTLKLLFSCVYKIQLSAISPTFHHKMNYINKHMDLWGQMGLKSKLYNLSNEGSYIFQRFGLSVKVGEILVILVVIENNLHWNIRVCYTKECSSSHGSCLMSLFANCCSNSLHSFSFKKKLFNDSFFQTKSFIWQFSL